MPRASILPAGPRLTLGSPPKLRGLNLNDNQNYWDSFWNGNWDPVALKKIIDGHRANGGNCVKFYVDGMTSQYFGGNGYAYGQGYPAASVFKQRLSWLTSYLRQQNMLIYLALNQSTDFVNSSTATTSSNISTVASYVALVYQYASDLLVLIDLNNEVNLGQIGASVWGFDKTARNVVPARTITDMGHLRDAVRLAAPGVPLTCSIYVGNAGDLTSVWMALPKQLGLDGPDDYHPYYPDSASVSLAPSISDVTALEGFSGFQGRHLIGECGVGSDAYTASQQGRAAGYEARFFAGLAASAATAKSFGAIYFHSRPYYQGAASQGSSALSKNGDAFGFALFNADQSAARSAALTGIAALPAYPAQPVSPAPSLPVTKAAIARLKAGTGRGKIMVIGDSTALGEGGSDSSASSYDGNAVKNSWTYVMAAALTAAGIPAQANGVFGDGGCGNYSDVAYAVFNPQFTQTSANTVSRASYPSSQTFGGSPWLLATAGTSQITVTPPAGVTKFRILFAEDTSTVGAVASYSVDGAAATTVAMDASGTGFKVIDTPTLAKGTHTLTIKLSSLPSTGTQVQVAGVYGIDETTPALDVLCGGNRGSASADWARSASNHDSLPAIAAYAPDLVIIAPPINDLEGGVALSTFTTNITAVVAAAKAAGADCLILNSAATRAGGPNSRPNQQTRDTYTSALRAIALAQGLPPISDGEAVTTPWDATRWRDDLHGYKGVYTLVGQRVALDILSLTR